VIISTLKNRLKPANTDTEEAVPEAEVISELAIYIYFLARRDTSGYPLPLVLKLLCRGFKESLSTENKNFKYYPAATVVVVLRY